MSTHPLLAPLAAPAPAPAFGFAAKLVRAVRQVGRALAHRREVKGMLEMDERMLKDIGLVRSDVLGALAEPLARDPSVLLRLRTVERRASRPARPARAVRPAAAPFSCDA